MNDPNSPQSVPEQGESAPTAPKSRVSLGRIIEWSLIAVFGLVVANEAYSKFSYDATFKSFNDLFDSAAKVQNSATIGEFDALVKGLPSRTETPSRNDENAIRVDYRWPSLFKSYHIVVSGKRNEAGKLAISNLDTNVPLDTGTEPDENEVSSTEGGAPGGATGGGHGSGAHGGAGGGAAGPPGGGPGGGPFGGPPGAPGTGSVGNRPGGQSENAAPSRPELEAPETDATDDGGDGTNE